MPKLNMRVSVVIPVFNEAGSILTLCRRLEAVLGGLQAEYELVFVDDGSSDESAARIEHAHAGNPRVKLLVLSRNFGQQAALAAGLDVAQGDVVITMDGDGQHPPELIPDILSPWTQGAEIVFTERRDSQDAGWAKRVTAGAFYWLFRRLSGRQLVPSAGDFRLYDRRVVLALRRFHERTRFLRGLAAWVGYRTAVVPYQAASRIEGGTKYSPRRMTALAADGLLSFSVIPLHAAIYAGFALGIFALGYSVFAIYARFVTGRVMPGWTSVAVLVSWIGCIQLLVLGVIGIYLGKVYEEAKRRPLYLVRASLGLGSDDPRALT